MPERCRLRDLGVAVGRLPAGPLNAITDVPGVRVGHCTAQWGGPDLPQGGGPARTGVTARLPARRRSLERPRRRRRPRRQRRGRAAHRHQLHPRVGPHRDPHPAHQLPERRRRLRRRHGALAGGAGPPGAGIDDAVMPVVGECDDGFLNDLRGMHVKQEHVWAALESAAPGPVEGGLRRGRRRHVALRVQGGHRHVVPARHRPRPAVHGGRAGADQLRRAPPPAGGRRAGRARDHRPPAGGEPRGIVHRGAGHRRSAQRPPVRAHGQALRARPGGRPVRTLRTEAARSWWRSPRPPASRARRPSRWRWPR